LAGQGPRQSIEETVPHRRLALLAAFVSALLVSMTATATPMPGWSTPVRALAAASKPAHSLAADSLGNVHIAVAGSATGGIKYVTNAYGAWYREQVTTNADVDPAIAVDSDGYAYIAFARTDGVKGIYVASNGTGSWVVDLRHAGADRSPSIEVRGGHVYLAFKTAAGSLMYLSDSSGTWQSHVVEAGCCAGAPSLRLTSTGLVRIAYAKLQSGVARALRFASRSGSGVWSLQTIDASASSDPTVVFGDQDDPYVVYVRHLGGSYWAHREATGTHWDYHLLNTAAHMKPDMEVFHANLYFVFGTPQTLYYTASTSGYFFGYVLSNTHKDSNPEFAGSRIIFNRSGTTSGDGIYFTHN
jgi:hypothetical protein